MQSAHHAKTILEKEKEILKEEKIIQEDEEKLVTLSARIRKLLGNNLELQKKEENLIEEEATFVQKFFVNKIKHHKVLFPFVVVTAVVLVWRGLWGIFDGTPILSSYSISLIVGLLLLWLFNKFTDLQ